MRRVACGQRTNQTRDQHEKCVRTCVQPRCVQARMCSKLRTMCERQQLVVMSRQDLKSSACTCCRNLMFECEPLTALYVGKVVVEHQSRRESLSSHNRRCHVHHQQARCSPSVLGRHCRSTASGSVGHARLHRSRTIFIIHCDFLRPIFCRSTHQLTPLNV